MSDLTRLSATAAATELARGAISAAELTEAYLARIAVLDATLNCFVAVRADSARREAREADARRRLGSARGPLDGIPVAVKDNIPGRPAPTAGRRELGGPDLRAAEKACYDTISNLERPRVTRRSDFARDGSAPPRTEKEGEHAPDTLHRPLAAPVRTAPADRRLRFHQRPPRVLV